MLKEKIAVKHKVAATILECPVCRHTEFWTRKTLMSAPGMTLFNFDGESRPADNYVCDSCGYVMWFLNKT